MEVYQKVALAVLGVLIVSGTIFLVIYVTQGGNGEVENIPGNPSDVVVLRR